jgi:hypothetical protein
MIKFFFKLENYGNAFLIITIDITVFTIFFQVSDLFKNKKQTKNILNFEYLKSKNEAHIFFV